ncbi:hypothetical protein SCA6_006197 [Theobroma cacao]
MEDKVENCWEIIGLECSRQKLLSHESHGLSAAQELTKDQQGSYIILPMLQSNGDSDLCQDLDEKHWLIV